jgi:hypothetical protein
MFSGETTAATEATKTEGESASLLTALVGEKQKYKSAEELAKAYANADEFIQKLKEENARLRQENANAKSLDEVLEQLKHPQRQEEATTSPSITSDAIASIVKQQLSTIDAEKIIQTNLKKADKAMKDKFGDKAFDVFKEAAKTPEQQQALTNLAAVDPDRFVALFTNTAASTPVDGGTVNTVGTTSTSHKKEWSKAWVNDVRKNDPSRYWSAEFQYSLQNEVVKNPKLYFD